ncbi:MAG: GldG family protein [Bdellovibrionales bacterium]|nr:GldG family protein [Bdellovibrionales bacterium]
MKLRVSQILFFLSVLSLFITLGARYVLGVWINLLYLPLGFFVLFILISSVLARKQIINFLKTPTTVKGVGFGYILLLSLALFVSINFIAIKVDKSFDFTKNKLFTLSDTSLKILENINSPITFKVFYYGQADNTVYYQMDPILKLYKNNSKKVKIEKINIFNEPKLSTKYLQNSTRKNMGSHLFVQMGEQYSEIESPFQESQISKAIYRLSNPKIHKIYFVQGHYEPELDSDQAHGLSKLSEDLKSWGFIAESLDLNLSQTIPSDASALAIVGPRIAFSTEELKILRDYGRSGGRFFIAIDPGEKHNMQLLTKTMGVQFNNDIVVDSTSKLGQSVVVAQAEAQTNHSLVDSLMGEALALPLVSSMVADRQRSPSIEVLPILKSSESSVTISEATTQKVYDRPSSYIVAFLSQGRIPKLGEQVSTVQNSYKAVIVGDSDFLSNKYAHSFANLSFAQSAFAWLSDQDELLNIPLKVADRKTLYLTEFQRLGIIFGSILFPVFILIVAFILWLNRRKHQ